MKHILLPIFFAPIYLLAQQPGSNGNNNTDRVNKTVAADTANGLLVVEGANPADIKISREAGQYRFPKPVELTVYPNPAVSDTRAVFTSNENGLKYYLSVIGVDGKTLLQKTGTTIRGTNAIMFNIGSYPTGTYVLQLFDGNTRQTARFLKLQ